MKLKKRIAIVLGTIFLLNIVYIPSIAQNAEMTSQNMDLSIEMLEQKYNVRIEEAPTASVAKPCTNEEMQSIIKDLDATLAKGKMAREENQKEYDQYMNMSGIASRETEPINVQ